MPLLFSYGTLQDEQVQLSVFGRVLLGRKDCLLGYEQSLARVEDPEFVRTSGKSQRWILRPARSDVAQVEGMTFEVTDEELEHTDRYEPVGYRRVVARLASGGQAWVYVDARRGAGRASGV